MDPLGILCSLLCSGRLGLEVEQLDLPLLLLTGKQVLLALGLSLPAQQLLGGNGQLGRRCRCLWRLGLITLDKDPLLADLDLNGSGLAG